jgi:tRNA(Ile)-lysidine synthase
MGKPLSLPPPYLVAYSGGADSTALLLWALDAAPGQVSAVHVHHGLQPAADDFAAHCQAFCAARGVPLAVLRVDAKAAPGQSPEDAARRARYGAISDHVLKHHQAAALANTALHAPESEAAGVQAKAESAALVLLGQHADDQVETLLLALSRGAGVDGLAGMAEQFERYGLRWARPFLMPAHFRGARAIREELARLGLQARAPGAGVLGQGWVEDPSNQSLDFTRNRIRSELLPVLERVFPQMRDTFARSARNMAQALAILGQDAIELEALVGLPPRIAALQALSAPRRANYLRHWLKSQHHATGSQAQMNELLDQIMACTTRAHQIHIRFAGGYIRREAECLRYDETP